MDLSKDIHRVAEEAERSPKLSSACSVAFQILLTAQISKNNTARLQYLAHSVADNLISIAEHMREKWDNIPAKSQEQLDEFEVILRKLDKIVTKSAKVAHRPTFLNVVKRDETITRLEKDLRDSHASIIIRILGLDARSVPRHFKTIIDHERLTGAYNRVLDKGTATPVQGERRRILSLGGDGCRTLSSLRILETIMERLERLEAEHNDGDPRRGDLRPCNHFDLIIGSGTGAISAILIGRLRMTVKEAIDEYLQLNEAASSTASRLWKPDDPPFDSNKLQQRLKYLVQRRVGDASIHMADPNGCRTAVFAARPEHLGAPPQPFRSYKTNTAGASELPVTEIAAASCAHHRRPVSLGRPPVQYINAAPFGYNNPTRLAMNEAREIWASKPVELVIHIGTGLRAVVKVGGSRRELTDAQQRIAGGDGDPEHESIHRQAQEGQFTYHRLQVDRGLEAIGLQEWKADAETLNTLFSVTDGYLRASEAQAVLASCVREISGSAQLLREALPQINRREDSDAVATDQDTDEFLQYTRADIQLLRRLFSYKLRWENDTKSTIVTLHEAKNRKDGQIVLVRTYGDSEPSQKKNAFSKDLAMSKSLWDPSFLQLTGVSRSGDSVPFQVYHAPAGSVEPFSDWIERTYNSNLVETLFGLYDMRVSIQNLLDFQEQQSVSCSSTPDLIWGSLVNIQSDGNQMKWSLVYSGELYRSSSDTKTASVEEEYGWVRARIRPNNIVDSFCHGSYIWAQETRNLANVVNCTFSETNMTILGRALVEMGWLGRCRGLVTLDRDSIGLGDLGYTSELGDFVVLANLHTALSSPEGHIPVWTYERSWNPSQDTSVDYVGLPHKRYERHRHEGAYTYVTCTLSYEDIVDQHAWKVLHRHAAEIIQHNCLSIAPNDLWLIASIEHRWYAHVEELNASETLGKQPAAADSSHLSPTRETNTHAMYIFSDMDEVGVRDSGAPEINIRRRASFETEPAWLHDDDLGHENGGEEIKDELRLMYQKDSNTHISYWQLPYSEAVPYTIEAIE